MKTSTSRRATVSSVVAAAAIVVSACTVRPDTATPTVAPTASTSHPDVSQGQGPEAPSIADADQRYEWSSDLDDAADTWGGLMIAGFEFPLFSDIASMAQANTSVVVGRRVGTGPSIKLGGDPDNDETSASFSIVVEILDVVRSQAADYQLQPPVAGTQITVIVNRRPSPEFDDSPALLFLRQPGDDRFYKQVDPADVAEEYRDYYARNLADWEAFRVGKYELMTSQSLLVGDSKTTVNPMRHPDDDPLTEEIRGVPIDEIVETVRDSANR